MTAFNPAQQLSKQTSAVDEAIIIQMAQKARDLRADGVDVVSLTIGEPDFDTPEHIRRAATDAMNAGFTHYAPIAGIPELRQALSDKLRTENGLEYAPDEIVVTNGAKQAITNAVFALVDPGDEVVLLTPFWVAYEGIIKMAGGMPKIVHAGVDENFKVPPGRLAEALGERTKLVILNSPCNPTGAVYDKAEMAGLAEVIAAHPRTMLLSDEIYEYIMFDRKHTSFGTLSGMRERTITVNGLSKGFAMTGWRVGYGAAPKPVAKAMGKVQGTFTAGGNAFVQHAAIAALKGNRDDVENMRQSYRRRRDLIIAGLSAIPGIRAPSPAGAFYIFPDVSAYFGKMAGNRHIDTASDLADWLLDTHHVATVPGATFGDDHCIRLSFAASDADITRGLERMAQAFNELA
jgi:aspartate aminotransferase